MASELRESISLAHWNVNGWTDINHTLRTVILQSLDADIISVNETHLRGEGTIDIEGYIWFGNNRITHVRAPRASGGVGILVKSWLFAKYKKK